VMSTSERSAPVVVLITGLPGAGKTTVGQCIADHFNLPFITKDVFKERIFDGLGWSDKAWSLKVSATTHRIMDYVIEQELRARHSIVVESNFKPDIDSVRFGKTQERFGAVFVQVLCWASGDVLFGRYRKRIEVGRHPGHAEGGSIVEAERDLKNGKCEALRIAGATLELDTTDFDRVDYSALIIAYLVRSRTTALWPNHSARRRPMTAVTVGGT
jgi:predicted kinase